MLLKIWTLLSSTVCINLVMQLYFEKNQKVPLLRLGWGARINTFYALRKSGNCASLKCHFPCTDFCSVFCTQIQRKLQWSSFCLDERIVLSKEKCLHCVRVNNASIFVIRCRKLGMISWDALLEHRGAENWIMSKINGKWMLIFVNKMDMFVAIKSKACIMRLREEMQIRQNIIKQDRFKTQ